MTSEEKFKAAVNVIKSLPKNGPYVPSNEMMLKFYSYYKQATEGPCSLPKPSFWEPVKKAKWDAWNTLGQMTKEEAMENYVSELKKIIETMSFSEPVAEFMDVLGPFYETVDLNYSFISNSHKSSCDSIQRKDVKVEGTNSQFKSDNDSDFEGEYSDSLDYFVCLNTFSNEDGGFHETSDSLNYTQIDGSVDRLKISKVSFQDSVVSVKMVDDDYDRESYIQHVDYAEPCASGLSSAPDRKFSPEENESLSLVVIKLQSDLNEAISRVNALEKRLMSNEAVIAESLSKPIPFLSRLLAGWSTKSTLILIIWPFVTQLIFSLIKSKLSARKL